MQKTVTVDGTDYVLNPMTTGDALDIQDQFVGNGSASDPKAISRWTFSIVAKSLRGVDDPKQIPWTHYQQLIQPALEINGFNTKQADAPGETQAGASPAA